MPPTILGKLGLQLRFFRQQLLIRPVVLYLTQRWGGGALDLPPLLLGIDTPGGSGCEQIGKMHHLLRGFGTLRNGLRQDRSRQIGSAGIGQQAPFR